jgi:endonuclease YncB( thermonuclease family)
MELFVGQPDLSWLFIVLAFVCKAFDHNIFSDTNRPLAAPGLALSAFLALLLASAVLGQEPVMYGRVVGVTDRDSLKILVAEQQLLRVRIAICQRNGNHSARAPSRRGA